MQVAQSKHHWFSVLPSVETTTDRLLNQISAKGSDADVGQSELRRVEACSVERQEGQAQSDARHPAESAGLSPMDRPNVAATLLRFVRRS